MSRVNGKTVVVTGAASGIGRALTLELARRGASLAISDVDDIGLAATARQARVLGARVHEQTLDVTDRDAMFAYADTVLAEFGAVHLVFNNAGVAFVGEVELMTFAQMERVMDVDFWGVVNGTKAFLPHLIASGSGGDTSHLINVSSLFGLLAMPSQSAYNAAKFAVRGFTESLRQELLIAGHPVNVTCVHPGGIKTAIVRNAGMVGRNHAKFAEFFDTKLAKTSPESAARTILRAVTHDRPRSVVGPDAKAMDVMVRVLGPAYQRLFATVAKRVMPAPAIGGEPATPDAAQVRAKVSA